MAVCLVDRESIPHCLFLGDLSVFCTEEILYEAFAPFGYIIYLQIARSKSNQKHLLFGFLGYEHESSAIEAMKRMDGYIVCGRAIK
jgi:RNA recognition motif-containing protein